MDNTNRPLSPHIGVYRWRITSTLSILHRGTGLALSLSALLLAAWLLAAASGAGAYQAVTGVIASPLGLLILVGASYAFFFHLANGIRHLFWDAGMGFEMEQARASGWSVVAVSIAATVVLWAIVLASRS
ncbi:MAG: succinate dehydrogenase, cytochrome b556 subunit [Gammaproteobacteria bacterium]|jgi:succinate dehydrogenase / fumarate reductase cytochrome b subunit|nr:succinate dehydrogenase, cytochrome b556 subunit [Gammaproteobacteria bacterium]